MWTAPFDDGREPRAPVRGPGSSILTGPSGQSQAPERNARRSPITNPARQRSVEGALGFPGARRAGTVPGRGGHAATVPPPRARAPARPPPAASVARASAGTAASTRTSCTRPAWDRPPARPGHRAAGRAPRAVARRLPTGTPGTLADPRPGIRRTPPPRPRGARADLVGGDAARGKDPDPPALGARTARPGRPVRPPRSIDADTSRSSRSETARPEPPSQARSTRERDGPGQRAHGDRVEARAVAHALRAPARRERASSSSSSAAERAKRASRSTTEGPGGLAEHGKHVVANPAPEQPRVVVARVPRPARDRPRPPAPRSAVRRTVSSGRRSRGASARMAAAPRSAEPRDSRISKRLGLVVGGVRGGDGGVAVRPGDSVQRRVAGRPGPRLGAGAGTEPQGLGVEWQSERPDELPDPLHLGGRLGTNTVVQRGHPRPAARHPGRRARSARESTPPDTATRILPA